MLFDVKSYSKIIGSFVAIAMAFIAIYVVVNLLSHAFVLNKVKELPSYHDLDLYLLIALLAISFISYKTIQFLSKIYFVFLEDLSALPHKLIGIVLKFLSIVPTPLLVALIFPMYTFDVNSIFDFTILMILLVIICAMPTAAQIAIDGLEGFSRQSYDAARGVGLSKEYALLNIVTVEHKKLFETSATVGIVRVVVENWILLTTTTSLSIKDVFNGNSLNTVMENSYSNITDKISLFYIALLLVLTLIGKIWTSVIASAVRS